MNSDISHINIPAKEQERKVWALLEEVTDPEVPVLSVLDLGIVRSVHVKEEDVEVTITPTYSGCPAMDMISMNIQMHLLAHGYGKVKIISVLSPAWTTDWMTESGKKKLEEYGIAPPAYSTDRQRDVVACPQCHATDTRLLSQFGSTACKALYQCNVCKEPFDHFKCH